MISVLENIDTKKRMLQACIDRLQAYSYELKAKMKNSIQKDRAIKQASHENIGFQSGAMDNLDLVEIEFNLDNAVKDMRILKYLLKTQEEKHDKVGLGAVVITHRNTFFVSADLQRFDLEGEKFIAISNECPLFKSMRGKKRGERFMHKGLSYQILDIY